MRITSKGQVTVPQEIREKLGFLPHTEVVFEIDGNTVRMRRAPEDPRARGNRVVERLRGRASTALSTEEILSLTRSRDNE